MINVPPPEDWHGDDESEDGSEDDEPKDPLDEILAQFGIESYTSIILDFANLPDGFEARALEFSSFDEAVLFLADIGVLGFSGVYYTEIGYGVAIATDTPKFANV